MGDGAGAHGARLKRHVKRRLRQAVIAELLRSLPHGADLGMRSRIAHCNRPVAGGGEHIARGADKHGTNGRLASLGGGPRFSKGHLHEPIVVSIYHRALL